MRKICRDHPGLRSLVKGCDRCGIWFLTGHGNRTRTDLRCEFGCRKERKREKTNERGRRHYLTLKGRDNKAIRNRERSLTASRSEIVVRPPPPVFVFSPGVLRYIARLLRLTSGQRPPVREIEEFLLDVLAAVVEWAQPTILRQRSLPERGG